ncbi:MAG TPA: hypothetical protein VFD92_25365 [Candidatus Binatia bacterium]|nr:hypothetical protein [Candidatus Binatia bacterium]
MTELSPGDLMRHRGPALLVDEIERREASSLACTASDRGTWPWPRMLEGAAQTAGLLAGFQPGGPANGVVAQYRDVVVHAPVATGALRFVARLDRRLLHFWRCRFEVTSDGGELLLEGLVTLAPDARA